MYMELDDEDDDDINILTCIKDVTFTCKQHGSFKLNHPPFIMEKWCVGVAAEMTIECIVSFEVRSLYLNLEFLKQRIVVS